MSIAEILIAHGLTPVTNGSVPAVPVAPRNSGTAPALVQSHVPAVPVVPVEKYRGGEAVDATASTDTRAALLALADRLGIDPAAVTRIPGADLPLWATVLGEALPAYLRALADTATRQAGKVPATDTAAVYCAGCGPVFVHPTIASVLPTAGGWPRALGCPWCATRRSGGYVPRPRITCERCTHFQPDSVNPAAGVGICASGHGTHWPMEPHRCGSFRPSSSRTDG